MKIDVAFYCKKCDGMSTANTCPHEENYRIHISGTIIRDMLKNNEKISIKISRPEVIKFIKKYYV